MKYRTRVKGKGKRWRKGQSSSSNPETKIHRDAAKSKFFQERLGHSNLTSDAVQKHNAFLGVELMNIDEVEEASDGRSIGSFKTFQTFASDWTDCSNISFNRLLKGFDSNSALHKEMLAVLAAVTEVIKSNGGQETTTEYFAALMTTLDATESEESVGAVLSLLGMGIKNVPHSVLRLKFSEASKVFLDLLANYVSSNNTVILRSAIGCLSALLRAQDMAVWSNSYTCQVLDSILSFTIYSKPKIRKAAQHAVCAVIRGSCFMLIDQPPAHHPAASQVAQFCVQHIASGSSLGGSTTTLHLLAMLKELLGTFPRAQLKEVCETVLKVMTLGNVLVLSCGMQAIHGLFAACPSTSALPATLNAQLIAALFDYQPAPTDQQPVLAWLAVMQAAYINLGRVDLGLWCANVPRLFTVGTQLWLTERSEIMSGTTLTMEAVLEANLKQASAPETVRVYKTAVEKIILCAETGLKYQYHSAWPYVLHLLGVLYEGAGETCPDLLLPSLKALGELRDTDQFSYKQELENAVGKAVHTMGPERVLSVIPLQVTGRKTDADLQRSWMLPVLKLSIHGAPLKFFIDHFLPIATMCRKQAQLLKNESKAAAISYELLQSQIWSLLPSFCRDPPDVEENFKAIAKILGIIISERKDMRLSVMASLRRLITDSQDNHNEGNLKEMKKFAKNYLPILFNVYTTKPEGSDDEGHRLAAFETIKTYLSIANADLCAELFDKACGKLNTEKIEEFVRGSIFDLLRSLIPYQDSSRLQMLYSYIEEGIQDTNDHHRQKKAYRMLEELVGCETENCKCFMKNITSSLKDLLLNSLSKCATSSRGPRLRCITHMVRNIEGWEMSTFQNIIPEAVICCKDVNVKCRAAAFALLVDIAHAIEKSSDKTQVDCLAEYIGLLLAGLSGSPTLMSATALALGKVMHEFRVVLPKQLQQLMLDSICQLVASPTREVVASALSYIKAYITSVPPATIASSVPGIVHSLVSMTEDCKRNFRQKCRNIFDRLLRKYGYSAISQLVPQSDVIMHKRLRNLKKMNERKKRENQRSEADSGEEDLFTVKSQPKSIEEILEDSDSDLADIPPKEGSYTKKKHSAWIQEEAESIIDFTDVSASKKIIATRPTTSSRPVIKKKKTNPFKMSSDGRLIISNNDDNDGDNPLECKTVGAGSDSDDMDEEADELSQRSSAKTAAGRKRKLSVSTDGTREPAPKYQAGGSGIHRPTRKGKTPVRTKHQKGPQASTGEVYKAKKAQGDIKRKGLPDPYAYIPLSRKALNKRKKMKQVGEFSNLVRAAHNGAKKGIKAKQRNKFRK